MDNTKDLDLLIQYRQALDISAIVSKTDPKGIITYVNDKFCEISGYSKDELIGQSHNIIRHPDMPKEFFKNLWETIKSKQIFNAVIKNKAKDGSAYYTDATIMPILNHNGEIVEYISIRFDVTSHEESLRDLKKAKEFQSIFLANMSHEVRTPLNGIVGFINILKQEHLTSKQKRYINILDSSVKVLLHTINEILDISKIQSGKLEVDIIEFDIYEAIKHIQELFIAKAKEKNINLMLQIDKNIPHIIKSDEMKLKQILSNLVGNAVKFTNTHGKIVIKVDLLNKNDKEIELFFSVKDNGIGIKKQAQQKIFEPFLQENSSTSRKFGGTGLGLAICKELVHLLGGDLKLNSQVGVGSEFYFSIKCEYTTKNIKQKEQVININSSYDGKVLVAEDDEINQELIELLLQQRGIRVVLANNGLQAYKIAKKEQFDLIFLDINMPLMDGVEACKKISLLNDTPKIALTANVIKGDKEKFLQEGFDDYLSKPIDIVELDILLSKYLKQSNKQNSLYDYKQAMQRLRIPKEFYFRLLDKFIKNFKDDFALLQKAFNAKDYDTLYHQSHKIKGASSNLEINEIATIAKEIENKAKNKLDISQELINNLYQAYEKLL
jgi:PAS domain S-box-containing protein